MASATAASAAASTMTNSAINWPSNPIDIEPSGCSNRLPKATKFRFAPLSTSSMPISTPSAFRLVAMQTAPQTNSTAPTTR